MMKWRQLVLHNGFVLVASLEAAAVSPPINLEDFGFVVLYGCAYVVFAFLYYCRTSFFLYFFLDPRFVNAPLAVIGLLLLCVALFTGASFVVSAAANHWWMKGLVILAAVGTCRWPQPFDAKPGDPIICVNSVTALLNLFRPKGTARGVQLAGAA